MNSYELVTAITALAVSIAQDYPDNTELDVLGSISARRSRRSRSSGSWRRTGGSRLPEGPACQSSL